MGGSPALGSLFAGRYRLRRTLAAGGMGAVLEALDERTGRIVALKLLHPELARDPAIRRRFRREASILAALDHPAVVAVVDVGEGEGERLYTAMERLEGETLHARMARGPLSPATLAPVVRDICRALEAAHAHGIIHGDVKPANIFLLGPDRIKLVDFGLSKVHGLERLTRTGEVLGTPAYMAPELLTGEFEVDLRIDVYAFGVVMYEALGGRLPFTERHPGKLLFRIAAGDAPPLAEIRPDVSRGVADVVTRAMHPEPEGRFPTASALRRAYERAALGREGGPMAP